MHVCDGVRAQTPVSIIMKIENTPNFKRTTFDSHRNVNRNVSSLAALITCNWTLALLIIKAISWDEIYSAP